MNVPQTSDRESQAALAYGALDAPIAGKVVFEIGIVLAVHLAIALVICLVVGGT